MKNTRVLSSCLIAVFIFGILLGLVYCDKNGYPWRFVQTKKLVQQYMSNRFKNYSYTIEAPKYSRDSESYYCTVNCNKPYKFQFRVFNSQGTLHDGYVEEKVAYEIKQHMESSLQDKVSFKDIIPCMTMLPEFYERAKDVDGSIFRKDTDKIDRLNFLVKDIVSIDDFADKCVIIKNFLAEDKILIDGISIWDSNKKYVLDLSGTEIKTLTNQQIAARVDGLESKKSGGSKQNDTGKHVEIYDSEKKVVSGSKDIPITFTVQTKDKDWYIIEKSQPA